MEELVGKGVHVKGWNKASVFVLEKIVGDKFHLITPRTGKRYITANEVYPTNKNSLPPLDIEETK